MDKATAQAIHELATTGRLSDDSTERVADVLGFVPTPGEDEPEPTTAARKGTNR